MQMIKISSIPIEYKIEIEKPRLEMKAADNASHKMTKAPAELNITSENIKVRLDTTDMRSSIGLKSVAATIADGAKRGLESIQQATAQYAQFGNQLTQINRGVDVSSIIGQRILEQPTTQMVFFPSVGPQISWQPNDLDIQYDAGSLSFDWQTQRNVMDFVPGKFTMTIMQYPKIEIEYLGGPTYVPPSADPNYEE